MIDYFLTDFLPRALVFYFLGTVLIALVYAFAAREE